MRSGKPIQSFRDLIAWQRARQLAVEVYHECQTIPKRELFTTVMQLRRSSESVSSNIAEGFGLGARPGFLRHLRIARGSLCEAESQREIAIELGLLTPRDGVAELIAETGRLLQGLITSLERSQAPGPTEHPRSSTDH